MLGQALKHGSSWPVLLASSCYWKGMCACGRGQQNAMIMTKSKAMCCVNDEQGLSGSRPWITAEVNAQAKQHKPTAEKLTRHQSEK